MDPRREIIVIGSANMDLVLPVERLPRAGETLPGGDLAFCPGGKGANQACAAGRLGGRVALIAQVGPDPFGDELVASLAEASVDTSRVGKSNRPTGCACIYVLPDGENSIVISPGANATLDPETALSRLDPFEENGYLLCQLEIPLATVEYALARAKSAGMSTMLDPAPAQVLTSAILRNVDLLTPNQSEAAAILGSDSLEIRDFHQAEEAAKRLLELGPATVVLKLGPLGCLVAADGVRAAVPAFRVVARDTTAAGDVFNGALAVALAEGRPVFEAAVFANAAAAISVTRPGAQASIPGRDEVEEFLQRNAILVR